MRAVCDETKQSNYEQCPKYVYNNVLFVFSVSLIFRRKMGFGGKN